MPANTVSRIARDLLALGVQPNGVLLVHSSLRSLGVLPGGAETVVRGLLSALGPRGTLLMPALSYMSVGPAQPIFDARRTPSCVGAIPEYFRTRPDTIRSVHPTHSVCGVGPDAQRLLGTHHQDTTPCGPYSPFSKLREVGGQVLFLGCGMKPNTSMHAIEEHVEPPYLFAATTAYQCTAADGSTVAMQVRNHGFRGYEQRYDRLAEHLNPPQLRIGPVLEATCQLVDARAMWEQALVQLHRNPLAYVDRVSG